MTKKDPLPWDIATEEEILQNIQDWKAWAEKEGPTSFHCYICQNPEIRSTP